MKINYFLIAIFIVLILLSGCQDNTTLDQTKIEACENKIKENMGEIKVALESLNRDKSRVNLIYTLPDCYTEKDSSMRIIERNDLEYCSDLCGRNLNMCTSLIFGSTVDSFTDALCLNVSSSMTFRTEKSSCINYAPQNDYSLADWKNSKGIESGKYTLAADYPDDSIPVICIFKQNKLEPIEDTDDSKFTVYDMLEKKRQEKIELLLNLIYFDVESLSVRNIEPSDESSYISYVIFSENFTDWQQTKIDFIDARFGFWRRGGNQFAMRLARHMSNLIQSELHYKGFKTTLETSSSGVLQTILSKVINSQDYDESFEVPDCYLGDYSNCTGNFSVTLDLSSISDADFKNLPVITVEDYYSGEIVSEPLFKKEKLVFNFPIRIFKAIAGAKSIAYSDGEGLFEIPQENIPNDKIKAKEFFEKKLSELVNSKNLQVENDNFVLSTYKVQIIGIENSESVEVRLVFEELDLDYTVDKEFFENRNIELEFPSSYFYSVTLKRSID